MRLFFGQQAKVGISHARISSELQNRFWKEEDLLAKIGQTYLLDDTPSPITEVLGEHDVDDGNQGGQGTTIENDVIEADDNYIDEEEVYVENNVHGDVIEDIDRDIIRNDGRGIVHGVDVDNLLETNTNSGNIAQNPKFSGKRTITTLRDP